jgi:hypothetical protein
MLFAISALLAVSIFSNAGLAANIGESVTIPYLTSADIGDWNVKVIAMSALTTGQARLQITHGGDSTNVDIAKDQATDVKLNGDTINVKVTNTVPGAAGGVTVVLSNERKGTPCDTPTVSGDMDKEVFIGYLATADIDDWLVRVSAIAATTTGPVGLTVCHGGQTTTLSLHTDESANVTLANDIINVKVTKIVPGAGGGATVLLSSAGQAAQPSAPALCQDTFVQYMSTANIGNWAVKVVAIGATTGGPVGLEVSRGGENQTVSIKAGESAEVTADGYTVTVNVIKIITGAAGGATINLCDEKVAPAPPQAHDLNQETFIPYLQEVSIADWSVKVIAIGAATTDPVGLQICRGGSCTNIVLNAGKSTDVTIGGYTITVKVTRMITATGGGAYVILSNEIQGAPPQREEIVQNVNDLHTSIENERQNLAEQVQNLTGNKKEVQTHGNAISLAVHALLASENLTGGIGRNVSEIAREFNNSIQTRQDLELRLANRNAIMRVLFGGDETAAKELGTEINTTADRLAQLQQLESTCNCSADVKVELQTQIAALQSEQDRQNQLVQKELANKGLLGWLFK